ncbi:MAG: ABC transporter ATP-binding protein [Agathobacter sp.]|nr:ABC transporter ATP-binding protein [Agathobacter sp.]
MKNFGYFMKMAWKTAPVYLIVMILNSLFSSAKLLLNIILPKLLIDELVGDKNIEMLFLFGALIVLNNVLMQLVTNTFKRYIDTKSTWLSDTMIKQMGEKIMNLEYSYLEDPYYLDLKERAVFGIENQNTIESLINIFTSGLTHFITVVGLVSIMATLGPVLIIALAIGVALMIMLYQMGSKAMIGVMQDIIPINRKIGYYMGLVMEKPLQKEIRLYDMQEMLTDCIRNGNETTCDRFSKGYRQMGKVYGGMSAISEFISAFTYAYVGIRTVTDFLGKKLSLGSLSMYVSSAISFSSTVISFGEEIVMLMQVASFLDPYLELMMLEEETIEDKGIKFEGDVETVEFRDVTFTYPKADKPVLRNISFEIKRGEKISIVGLNGAGKSTLIKLICRMYKADSGDILVNGRNIYDYDYMSYMNVISAVFQDYKLFNFSIEENISCNAAGGDEELVNRLIDEVGMREKVDELPNGIKSRFGKEYDEEGIEMSGGQGQKIAIARALYKKASMVILDEPASALDPIAEAEIYEKFNSLVEDKTAIYISHRMSSSVFCDKILIIDGGIVADFDTHENLMKKTDSLYYKLFDSQAQNYKI